MNDENEETRKLAAIMFTDMVGYSALTQRNESLAIQLLEEHRNLLRPLFPKYGGREIEATGDSFFLQFGSALEAVQCAVEMQHTLHERNQITPPEEHIRIRIGIHLGDVVEKGNLVLGDGVNIAARLEPLAPPEGICISEDVARQVQNKLDIPLHKLGQRNLKNIQFPMEIYTVNLPWQEAAAPLPAPPPVQQPQPAIVQQAQLAIVQQPQVAIAQEPQPAKKEKSKSNTLWYTIAGGAVAGGVAAYFVLSTNKPTELPPPPKQTVLVETVRVKEPTTPLTQQGERKTEAQPTKTKPQPIAEAAKYPDSTKEETPAQTNLLPPAVETPSPNLLANADSIYAIAVAKYKAGDLVGAKAACDEALALYKSANSNANVGKVQRLAATILLYQDVLNASKQLFEEAESMLQRAGENEAAALAALGSARVLIEQKKLDEAETNLNQIVSKNAGSNASAGACGWLAHLALTRGNTDDAQKQLQEADRRQTRGKDATVDMLIETAHARCDAALGKTAQEMKQEMQAALSRVSDVASDLEVKFVFAAIAAKHMKSETQPQQRFQRNPRRGAMQAIQQRFETVRSEAAAKGFTLIARKASDVLQR